MRVLSGLLLALCVWLGGVRAAGAQDVTFVLLDEEDATSVADVAVTVRRRPVSATPRFSAESIMALRDFGRAHLTETFRNSAGSSLRRASDASSTSVIRAPIDRLSTPTGASRNQRRTVSLRLVRAAETALRATRSAESVFTAYVDHQASERDLLVVERQREKAVKTMLAARTAALAVLRAEDDGVFLLEDRALSEAPTVEALPEGEIGWSFDRLDIKPVARAGAPAIQVTGLIRNDTDARASMPPFRVIFYDQHGQPFSGAVTMPHNRMVNGRASSSFTISVTDMAATPGSGESGVSRVALAFSPPPKRGGL